MSGIATIRAISEDVTDSEVVNNEFIYQVNTEAWQMIRPSFLTFLNDVVPKNNNPWSNQIIISQMAEIGVAGGINSLMMLKAYKNSFLYMIDSYALGQTEASADGITKSYEDRRKIVIKTSSEAVKDFPDNFFDYLYLDASHDYESVLHDMELWYPKVKLFGMMAGHDWMMESVRKGVTTYLQKNELPERLYGIQPYFQDTAKGLTDIETHGIDWWFVKRVTKYQE